MWITRASHSGHTTRVIGNLCSSAQVEDALPADRRLLWLLVLSKIRQTRQLPEHSP